MIEISTRARNEETRQRIIASIERIVRAESAAGGLSEPTIVRAPGAEVTVNDAEAAATVQIPRQDLRGEYAKWQGLAQTLAERYWTGPVGGIAGTETAEPGHTAAPTLPCSSSCSSRKCRKSTTAP